jgi:hypothetical protein
MQSKSIKAIALSAVTDTCYLNINYSKKCIT